MFPASFRCLSGLLAGLLACAPLAAQPLLRHRYSFTTDATDTLGGAHGWLQGGAVISNGAVHLDGATAFVDLPNGLVATLTNATFETWLVDHGSGPWSRILDFGFSTGGEGEAGTGTNYLFLSPNSGAGTLRGAIRDNSQGGEQLVEWPGTRLPVGEWKHVVWTLDATVQTSRLYVDGALVGENSGFTRTPAQLGVTVNNWLGRSQFAADAWLNASLTEFRIYEGALTAAQVQSNFVVGPDVALLAGPVRITSQPASQTAPELAEVQFEVGFEGTPPVGVQWQRNGLAIPGATNASLTVSAALTNHGAAFSVLLTNQFTNTAFSVASSNAILSVVADLLPPVLQGAASAFPTGVVVTFSEPVDPATGLNPANYVITNLSGSLTVTAASPGPLPNQVRLTTAPQTLDAAYTLTVNGVRDRAVAANPLAANSQAVFIATTFTLETTGNGSATWSTAQGGYAVTAAGSGFSGTADGGALLGRPYTNDFDVRVRVAQFGYGSAQTVAGLMARSGVASNQPFAAVFASPGPAGCHFAARANTNQLVSFQGAFPGNGPDTWLRLRRIGATVTGYASLDGQTWHFLGSTNPALPAVVTVGLAVTSGRTDTPVTAQFNDVGVGAGTVVTNAPLPFEPPGPSSRRTALVLTEIMYNPRAAWPGGDDLEFVELWNSGLITEDLTGHRFEGEITYTFPPGTRIAPGQFLVLARNPAAAQSFYGVPCLGPLPQRLNNAGGTVRLVNELGGTLLEVTYGNAQPWPAAANGTGHSLVLARPSYGENDPRAWAASDVIGGSPGRHDGYGPEPARGVVLNEFLAHTTAPALDFVELFNPRAVPVDLSGCWLSDNAATNKFRIPNGTVIPARGWLSFTETQLGFALDAAGERLFLVNSNQTRVLDAFAFGGQEHGVSTGRFPDGFPDWVRLADPTPGTTNAPPRIGPVVINEIMYHPLSGRDDDEYVELHNLGATPVSLAGWQLQDGISFTFPTNAVLAPGGYVVAARNLTNLLARYPQLNATNAFGNYSGRLSNGGERIALAMPHPSVSGGQTNPLLIVVNEVTYADGGRWGQWADGGGSSLELVDPRADNRFAANWADSDESAKAAWTTINVTNVLENGQTTPDEGTAQNTPNRLELFHPAGAGEALVDNVEFRNNGGSNRITNGTFAVGTNGWVARGTTRRSFAEPGVGLGGSQALRLVSTARGDNGPNKLYTPLTATATVGGTNTGIVRASVRWLKGSPYVMFRLRGNWMEVCHPLNVPADCGTPGLPNSRRVSNAGPVITDVTHSPVLPAAGQPVTVSARVLDPDGVASAQLRYRVDPLGALNTLSLTNDGGWFRATLPAQGGGTLVAFHLVATDGAGATAQFPADAPARECLVRWGETPVAGALGSYRLWLTASNVTFWTTRERNANDLIDATFVYGQHRAIYNVGTMYSGSPFHTPIYTGPLGANPPDFEVNFPPEDRLLGAEAFVLSAYLVGGGFFYNDPSAQVDLTGTWIGRRLGQQYNHRRHLHLFVNGVRRGTIYDDTQQPNGDMLEQYFPGDDGVELRKVESWFEFADDGQTQSSTYARLTRVNASDGSVDAKRYRWNWRPRATRDPNDWFHFTNLVVAVSQTNEPGFLDRLRLWMDLPPFLRPIATHHICGSWDSYGYERGKNMYAAKPTGQPWRLLLWDIEIALGAGGKSTTDSIYNMPVDVTLARLITNYPVIHREYLRAFQEAVDGPLAPGAADAALDERYAVFQSLNLGLGSPQFIKNYLAGRRAYLQTVLPNAAFTVAGPPTVTVTDSNTVRLTGTGPLALETLLVNGAAYPLVWTSVTNWQMVVPLLPGTNLLQFTGRDRSGQLLTNVTGTITVHHPAAAVAPEEWVVFNEIQYRAAVPGAEFVELFNRHTNHTFDLSGWRVNGLGYTFPAGATLGPRQFLVLAADPVTFNLAYGPTNLAFAAYPGTLDPDGETLTLFRPGGGTNEIVVDRVRYEALPPWPAPAPGVSLQLVDATQDNSRVANWRAATNPPWATPGRANSVVTNLPAFPPLWLNELQAENLTGPTDNFGQRDPWVELHHAGNGNLNLAGYHLADSLTNLTRWPLPAGLTIASHGFLVVWCDGQTNQTAGTNAHANFTLPPATGLVTLARLVNGQPQLLDYLRYTNLAANWSHGAVPDGQPFYRRNLFHATPGATNNSAAAPLQVFINEWLADNVAALADPADNNFEDWFELYNPGTNAVDLGGCYLTDTLANPFKFPIPNNGQYVIPPGGFLLVWADNEAQQNQPGRPDLHVNFALSKDGEAIGLYAADGTPIDVITFGPQTTDISQGRFPDGAAALFSMSPPTPRAPNRLPNTPPQLDPLPNRVVTLGQTLTFTALATDPDLPAQTLTFSLSNAPLGAAIAPASGLFTWTPAAPATASITVVVTDNGLPPLTAARSFTVTVVPPPQALTPRLADGAFLFDWLTHSGQSFRVESAPDLAAPVWTPLTDPLPGTGGALTFTNELDGSPQRFFRLRVLP